MNIGTVLGYIKFIDFMPNPTHRKDAPFITITFKDGSDITLHLSSDMKRITDTFIVQTGGFSHQAEDIISDRDIPALIQFAKENNGFHESIKLTKDTLIEGNIVEAGTEVRIVEEEALKEERNQFFDFSEYEGMKGEVLITWKNISTLSRLEGTLEIDRKSSPTQVPFIRNKGCFSQFEILGGEVDTFSNGFKITKDDIIWSFFKI